MKGWRCVLPCLTFAADGNERTSSFSLVPFVKEVEADLRTGLDVVAKGIIAPLPKIDLRPSIPHSQSVYRVGFEVLTAASMKVLPCML
jgi:hypothetical protein